MKFHLHRQVAKHKDRLFASAVWGIYELPGLFVARGWIEEEGHQQWVVIFEESADLPHLKRALPMGPFEAYLSEEIFKKLQHHRFPTRKETLQALEMALVSHI